MRLAVTCVRFGLAAMLAAAAVGCGTDKPEPSQPKEQGLIGTTCYAKPVVLDDRGRNACITPDSNWPGMSRGEFWYVIGVNIVARAATVKACEEANALDYGVRWGKSCYKACQEVVSCVGLTPNPDV